ncbi:hypothetical protein TNIN_490901 [Trichonephila inaurata madagascariensis]|uniref:Uncharacterized protein n=1 Tax=Trichonephila inaurata madagascariensis TaxID=2747483 RepID=A0A8X6YD03_9ARAC|nr:hypothetical protein TNIN_490901 [Trichonephila inaurata madagascariensis]
MDKEVENSDPSVCVQFATQAAAVLKEPTSKPVETTGVPDSQTALQPSESETIRVEETVDMELVERAEGEKDDSSYNGQESIPAKDAVIPTSLNEKSGKNTSAVCSQVQEKGIIHLMACQAFNRFHINCENSDPSVCVRCYPSCCDKEPTSKPVETAGVPDSQTALQPSESETIRVEETVDMELVERAEGESSGEYICCEEFHKRLHETIKMLSPQNFEGDIQEICSFSMNAESSISSLVDIIHEKATEETEASTTVLWAKLCKRLMKIKD